MKRKSIFAEKEVTIMLGDTTGSNIQASLSHAGQITKFNRLSTVLYINTVQTDRKLSESVRKIYNGSPISGGAFPIDERKIVHVLNSPAGELHKLREKIEGKIWEHSITTVIINSWEYASKNSRYREELIFMIKHLLEGNPDKEATNPFEPQTVIVYGEKPSQTPIAGKIQRGGYGKLSGVADKIFFTDANGELENYETKTTEKISEIMQEAQEILSIKKPKRKQPEFIIDGIEYPNEDEEGISREERHDRFVNRMRAIGRRQERIKAEKSARKAEKLKVQKEKEEIPAPNPTLPKIETQTIIDTPIIEAPVTSIEELRNIPDSISRMPIHLNNYSPDKTAIIRPSKTRNTISTMIKK